MTQPDAATQDPAAPPTEVEQLVIDVWSEVLGRDRIGVHEDFFELGGQSLQVVRVINKIQQLTGVELDSRAFFEAPTAAGLAEHLLERFAELDDAEAGGEA
jgi:acyl carrier protein